MPGKLTREMLAALPPGHIVVSFHMGCDRNRGLLFKFLTRNGKTELHFIATSLMLHIKRSFQKALAHYKWPDIRRRKGDPRPEEQIVADFLAKQPDITDEDWGMKPDGTNVPINVEVHAFSNAVFVGLQQNENTYRVVRFPPDLLRYLIDIVADYERDGGMVDIQNLLVAGSS